MHTGRIITGLFFVLAGINKVLNYAATQSFMVEGGLPLAEILLPLVILLEICGGAIIMIGRGKLVTTLTVIVLAVFTFATNLLFHRFWELDGLIGQLELSLFFKNLVVIAALLMITGLTYGATQAQKSPP
ncbi:MAG: DoxX family protein [Pseudomonadota bacterium]